MKYEEYLLTVAINKRKNIIRNPKSWGSDDLRINAMLNYSIQENCDRLNTPKSTKKAKHTH